MNYVLHLLVYLSIYVIVALSLNLILGYCGRFTMAHAAYFAIGAYTYALTSLKLEWSFLPATLAAVAMASLLSLAVSLPAWKLHGDLFILISLCAQVMIFSVIHNWGKPGSEPGSWANLTNGAFGLAGIPAPVVAGVRFESLGAMATLSLVLASGCAVIFQRLQASPWGRLLKCMRDDELAASSLGKNTRLAKVQAFAIGSGTVAVAGALYASYVRYIEPSTASLDQSLLMLCIVLVGGPGNFAGPIVGAALLLAMPEAIRFLDVPDAAAANIRLALYGLLLIVIMHFRPQGLAGTYRYE